MESIDQIKSVAKVFCAEPNSSYHVVSIFRPIDLLEKFRPGYVPCVISADFKYRNGKLNGKFFFRSCDGFNLFPFDLFYCAGILDQLHGEIVANGFNRKISVGEITFWFSRIYVSRFDIAKCGAILKTIDRFEKGVVTRPRRSLTTESKRKQRRHVSHLTYEALQTD